MDQKLLVFSYDYPPGTGGIARLCHEISNGLKPYFKSVTVLTRKKEHVSTPYDNAIIDVVELPTQRPKCELAALNFLKDLPNKDNYIVLCGLWHPEAGLAYLSGFKNVYILGHGTEFLSGSSLLRRKVWLPYYCRKILGAARAVICNSRYTRDIAKRITDSSRVEALPLAVNHNFFSPVATLTDGRVRICTVSRIEKFKGHDLIASAIASLPTSLRESIEWNIAGTGPDLDYVKNVVKSFKIKHLVKFHGFVPDKDLPIFYNENDLFILCSRESPENTFVEGFGLVFLEAQSCGLPVIGANTGGIRDAIDNGEGGWLIDQDNKEQLITLLTRLIKEPKLLKEMGDRARRRVISNFTWEIYCRKLMLLIKKYESNS